MPEAFSLNREYDFIRLEGLYRATGRPAHEWDFYIIKELLDNALDADETLWSRNPHQFPNISVHIEYISVPPPQRQQLFVRVSNRASFPTEKIQAIFATQWYTSRKAFLKGLTRGTLGNALKTLLGIPYALHNRVAEDWKPDLKPLSICQGQVEYLPRYTVDPITQEIRLTVEAKPCKPQSGTMITVGLDYFVQEIARTREEITALAAYYHACNPHAAFRWSLEMEDQVWEQEYPPQPNWANKFSSAAPIQWYSLADFKELLGALYREQNSSEQHNTLAIEKVCQYFSGLQKQATDIEPDTALIQVLREVGQLSLAAADIEGPFAKTLYLSLGKHTLPFPASRLGAIGVDHLDSALREHLPIEGKIHYVAASDPEGDPSMPFVIEAAAAFLKEGKRQLWTALNFSPTYNDPFLSRYLSAPAQPKEPVLGLRGVLDAYNFREDVPMLLFMHLICPNIEHNEFSKTEINHLPFKKVLGEVLDQLLSGLRRGREAETLPISSAQLPDPTIEQYVVRQAEMLLSVPSHPDSYFSLPMKQLSRDLLEQHYINKLLYVPVADLESVIIANNWLCLMDMALIHAPVVLGKLEEVLSYCLQQSDLPILILHNGDDAGQRLAEQMRRTLQLLGKEQRVIELNPRTEAQTMQLSKLTPAELESWLVQRFAALGIPVKYAPSLAQIRQDISMQLEQRLRGYFIERMGQRFELTNLIIDLDTSFAYTQMMIDQHLDKRLLAALKERASSQSYATALSSVVEDFFVQFMEDYGSQLRQREQQWLAQRQGKRHD